MVKSMRGVNFEWKDTGKQATGVIAQELEQVLPNAVNTTEDGTKTVTYTNIIGVLIEAIKEQQKQIDELKSMIK
jgi:hypothetical protein